MGGNTRSAGRRRSRWTALAAATGLVALAVVPVGAPIATAADTEADSGESVVDGTWYFDRFGIGALHEQGITGADGLGRTAMKALIGVHLDGTLLGCQVMFLADQQGEVLHSSFPPVASEAPCSTLYLSDERRTADPTD